MIPSITIGTIKYYGDTEVSCFVAGSATYNDDAHVLEHTPYSVQDGVYVRLEDVLGIIRSVEAGLEDCPASAGEALRTVLDNIALQAG